MLDGFIFAEIQNIHIFNYSKLDSFDQHKDPFDRLLIATAVEKNAIILSGDRKFDLYSDTVKVLWE